MPNTTSAPILEFYTRPGCHLCDVAMAILSPVAQRYGLQVHTVNIAGNEQLEAKFGHLIPVVTIDGNAIFTYRVDAELADELLGRYVERSLKRSSGDAT